MSCGKKLSRHMLELSLVLIVFPAPLTNIINGLRNSYLHQKPCMFFALLLSLGLFGNPETKLILKKKLISAPSDIIYLACSFLHYWADLLQGLTKEDLMHGVDGLMQAMSQSSSSRRDLVPGRLLLLQGGAGRQEAGSRDAAMEETEAP
uniref:Uncharacterized protein n=1 Tax=Arundo donax TaxID=35708 RepID=A0A0A9GY65_ARUDO